MTFTENLESARSGNKRFYGMLCNEYANRFYAVAILVLDNPSDGETAVRNAFDDGFRAINRINDGNHLQAWLTRELTKHIVAKLKEYRAENKTISDNGMAEKKLALKLNDLDRLVYVLNLTFGYGVKEITVITGLKEESVERKLRDSEKKLAKERDRLIAFINSIKAPEALITKPPQVHDLTVEIDTGDDDELIGEMERIAAFAEAEENGTPIPEVSSKAIRFMPAAEEKEEPKPEIKINKPKSIPFGTSEKEESTFDFPTEEEAGQLSRTEEISEDFVTDEASQLMNAPTPAPEETALPVTMEEAVSEAVSEQESIEEQPPIDIGESDAVLEKPKELDARTFINVITAQKIKGSEFLKLMGNTRISNTAYREIEQNPNLTKEKLIRLLEDSPLTSEDYVKVLTAIKQRSELMNRKEEASRRYEQAGLFSANKKESEPAEMPAPEIASNDTQSFSVSEPAAIEAPKAVEKNTEEPEKPAPIEEEKPFVVRRNPVIDFSEDDEPDDGDEYDDTPPPPVKAVNTEPVAAPTEKGKREKYKGREYFIDDDVYYKGVNNGKIAFCAVFAVLLIAGSFGIRYLKTGNWLPTDNPASQQTVTEEKLPEEYLSNDDIYKAISMLEVRTTQNQCGYYKTDGNGYAPILTKDFAETEDMFFIYNDGKILIYSLNAENPAHYSELAVDETKEFLGFCVTGENNLCLLYSDSYTETLSYTVEVQGEDETVLNEERSAEISRQAVLAECYDKSGNLLYSYQQDGDLRAIKAEGKSIALATFINTSEKAAKELDKTYLPSYTYSGSGGEKTYIGYENITVPKEISYNGFTVIGKFGESEARAYAVLGGSDGYAEFEGDKCFVLIPDENRSLSYTFKFIGSTLSLDKTEAYIGECFGIECINDTSDIITAYDSANQNTLVQKKSGDEYIVVGGIGQGEKPKGVSYTENKAYIVTENAEGKDMLYCVDTSGEELLAVDATQDALYTEKLKSFGNKLIGMTVEADESGNRTDLSLNVYEYSDGLKVLRSANVGMDEKTATEYVRYLSGDAEESNLRIATNDDNTLAAISTVYFDGISEIERIVCYKDDGTSLSQCAELMLFDIRSDYRYLTIRGNILYILTDSSVVTINADNGDPVGYFRKDAPIIEEVPEETTESADEAQIS